jgi:hypothetical protein
MQAIASSALAEFRAYRLGTNEALKVSISAAFFNQVADRHLASVHFLAKGTQSYNNFPVRDLFLFFFDRD